MNPPGGEQPREYPDRKPLPLQPHWVQDFPTDVPEDDHVARREFVKFLVLTSGAFVAGQCWIAAAARREGAPPPRKKTVPLDAAAEAQLAKDLGDASDGPLKAALLSLGRGVLRRRTG